MIISNRKWEKICIVGFGAHAQTKILPALLEAGYNKIYIVTNKVSKKNKFNIYDFFNDIDDAINQLDQRETLFVVSSPPECHQLQSIKILKNGFDIMVEKPAFVTLNSFNKIKNLAYINKSIFVEMFMYLENFSSKYFINLILDKLKIIDHISLDFTIPTIPKNTFRQESSFHDSLLLDIGCYPISFLNQIDKNLQNDLEIIQVSQNGIYPLYRISNNSSNVKVNILIGCDKHYSNRIDISFKNNSKISYMPFFYGRSSNREFSITSHNKTRVRRFYEPNSFVSLFKRNRSSWLQDQELRFSNMNRTIKTLSKLSIDIKL